MGISIKLVKSLLSCLTASRFLARVMGIYVCDTVYEKKKPQKTKTKTKPKQTHTMYLKLEQIRDGGDKFTLL